MAELNFKSELPPGFQLADGPQNTRGVNKKLVYEELKNNPGEWAKVYDETDHQAVRAWRNDFPGVEVASKRLAGRDKPRYEIWLRYLPDLAAQQADKRIAEANGLVSEERAPEEPIEQLGTPEAESRPVPSWEQPQAPTPPAPLMSPAVAPQSPAPKAPKTAFQQTYAEGGYDDPGF